MSVLITGASGLLGRKLIECCNSKNISYVGTYNFREITGLYKINFGNENELSNFLKEKDIRVCINCIVQRQVDICENSWNEIKKINVDYVDILSKLCEKLSIYLIHISTDYVFDGYHAPYFPNSEVNPIQNYGISKLLAEKRIITNMKKYSIIRVPVLYSDNYENLSESAVTVIGKKVMNKVENTTEDDFCIRRPVFIPEFCEFILSFVQNPQVGIFHFYNKHYRGTKYDIAKLIGNYLSKSIEHIQPVKATSNNSYRPYDTELSDNTYNIYDFNKLTMIDCIDKCFKKWKHPPIMTSTLEDGLFIMLDLDGTILDTDDLHYMAYKKALQKYGIELDRKDFYNTINFNEITSIINHNEYKLIKNLKQEYLMENTSIEFMPGAERFIEYLIKNNINFVVITNTNKMIVDFYKIKLPLLNKISNWITREDYSQPKPNSECYKLAKEKFYKCEKYILGFENTFNGYNALKSEADCIYFITTKDSINYNKIKKEDIYLISSFDQL